MTDSISQLEQEILELEERKNILIAECNGARAYLKTWDELSRKRSDFDFVLNHIIATIESDMIDGDLIADEDVVSQWERLANKTQKVADEMKVFIHESIVKGRKRPINKSGS